VEALLAPDPAAHAVLLAAHSGAHEVARAAWSPARRSDGPACFGVERAAALAYVWGSERMWRTTLRTTFSAVDAAGAGALSSCFGRAISQTCESGLCSKDTSPGWPPQRASSLPPAAVPGAIIEVVKDTRPRRGVGYASAAVRPSTHRCA
jgi:hypothetical protein